MSEKEPRVFQGWMGKDSTIPRDTVLSTEGQVPPEPPFSPPELFTDLDGQEWKYVGSVPRANNKHDIMHAYVLPEGFRVVDGIPMAKTHRLIREPYIKGVLERQEWERQLEEHERELAKDERQFPEFYYHKGYPHIENGK